MPSTAEAGICAYSTGASSPTCARRAAQDAQKSPRIASTDPSASSATAVQDGVTQTIALIGP